MNPCCFRPVSGFVLLAMTVVAGCNSVQLDTPIGKSLVGEELYPFVGEWQWNARLEGDAVVDGGTAQKHTSNAEVGEHWTVRMLHGGGLLVGRLKWSQAEQKYFIQQWRADVTELGSTQFLNLRNADDGALVSWVFGRIHRIDDDKLHVQFSDFQKFQDMLDQGELKGKLATDEYSKTMSLSSQSLERYLSDHPDQVDQLFSNYWGQVDVKKDSEESRIRVYLQRISTADDQQQYFDKWLATPLAR